MNLEWDYCNNKWHLRNEDGQSEAVVGKVGVGPRHNICIKWRLYIHANNTAHILDTEEEAKAMAVALVRLDRGT